MRLWQRLWWRIWLAVLAAIVLVALSSFALLRILLDTERLGRPVDELAHHVAIGLPAPDAAVDRLQGALERVREQERVELALFDAQGRPVAFAGRPLPPPRPGIETSHWVGRDGRAETEAAEGSALRRRDFRPPPIFALRLDDGRWLVASRDRRPERPPFGPLFGLLLLAAGVGLGAYPVARRLTRRLERLQAGVEELGAGQLHARVPVEGRDEVARLAERFNVAAERIEALVNAQRALLANASHELRSPLARVRLALELLADGAKDGANGEPQRRLRDEVQRDIGELDALIDEILLASRLDAQAAVGQPQPRFDVLDLTALVAEESARFEARLDGTAVHVAGDARLLRRLVRNLLENARRYGSGRPIDVALRNADGAAELTVADRGPGVPDDERQRIFEPFYRARGAGESAGAVGLGLALVARIATLHGGRAECRARDGGGSVFRVTLPLPADR